MLSGRDGAAEAFEGSVTGRGRRTGTASTFHGDDLPYTCRFSTPSSGPGFAGLALIDKAGRHVRRPVHRRWPVRYPHVSQRPRPLPGEAPEPPTAVHTVNLDPLPHQPVFLPGAAADVPPEPADLCLVVADRKLLVGADGGFLRVADLPAGPADRATPDPADLVPLGTLDRAPVWAATRDTADEALGAWLGWRELAAGLAEPLAALAGRALQVVTWRRTHRYCGACTTELTDVPGEHARRCPNCQLYVPMQLSPAVLVAIRRPAPAGGPEQLLLVRHSYGPTETWALVAGFVEAGETLEQAVHREVAEEVGLRVDRLTYFGSQPWAMSGPGVVLAGFTAYCPDPDVEPVVDGRELTQARWFPLDALPDALPPAYSISRWLVESVRV